MASADRRAQAPTFYRDRPYYQELNDERRLLQLIDSWARTDWDDDPRAPRPYDGTWGYYVFLTSYDDATLEKVEQAMDNWVRLVERRLATAEGPHDKNEELRKRFKLELIKDEAELAGASDDRVRENFCALMRDLDLWRGTYVGRPQARYSVCLAIDAAAVDMLAGLQFLEDPDQDRDYRTFENLTVKVIDALWDRDQERWAERHGQGPYMGVGWLSINGLQDMYLIITRDANTGAMDDLYPLNGYPG
jgi:hypothetical protein